jgi:squalene-hopene/tetraprenyl-beta-curcumene cyclase
MHNEEALRRVRAFEPMRRAVAWVKSVQNADGGFGESANSYLNPALKGRGPSTASQTAWGLMCLLYVCDPAEPCVQRAVKWLCDHQLAQDKAPFEPARTSSGRPVYGTAELSPKDWVWDHQGAFCEHVFTGTGFPKVFYLRYNMYRHYFPVMALGRYVRAMEIGVR